MKSKKLLDAISDEEFIKIVEDSKYLYQVGSKLGYTSSTTYGSIGKDIKNRMTNLNVKLQKTRTINLETYSEDSYHGSMRRIVIKDNLIKYACAICGNDGTWLNQKLVLQLDHINGNASDNRLENLRFLCPNCHTQTTTFGNKNKMKRTTADRHAHYNKICKQCGKPFISNGNRQVFCSRECVSNSQQKVKNLDVQLLISQIKEFGFRGTAQIYDVSDNAVRHWCQKLGISAKASDYK